MAITFINFALSGTTDSTTLNITLPTVQANDILLLEYTHRGTGEGTLGGVGGSGWTKKGTQLYATDTFSVHLWWKRCDGSESGDALTVSGLSNSCAGCVTLYRGVELSGDPIVAFSGESNASGDESHAAITASSDGAWVVLTVANAPDLAVASQSCTSPGALTERAERLNVTGLDTSIAHASAEKASAGSTGALTWAQTNGASGSLAYTLEPSNPLVRTLGVGAVLALGLSVGAAFTGPAEGLVRVTGRAPTISVSAGPTVQVPAGTISVAGRAGALRLVVPVPRQSIVIGQQATALSFRSPVGAGQVSLLGRPPSLGVVAGIPAGGVSTLGRAPVASVGGGVGPPAGSVAVVGRAPVLALRVGAPSASVAIAGRAPVASISGATAIPVGQLLVTGASVGVAFQGPLTGTVVVAGRAPVVSVATPLTITVPVGSVKATGRFIAVKFKQPDEGKIHVTGRAPTALVSNVVSVAVPRGQIALTGRSETLARGITQLVGSVSVAGRAPSLVLRVLISRGSIAATGHAPNVEVTQPFFPPHPRGQIFVTGRAPTLGVSVSVPRGSVSVAGTSVRVRFQGPDLGVVRVAGRVPLMVVNNPVSVPSGGVTLAGRAPALSRALTVPTGSVKISGRVPTLVLPGASAPDVGRIALTGRVPTLTTTAHISVTIPVGQTVVAGRLAGARVDHPVAVGVGVLLLTGRSPQSTVNVTRSVGVGTLVVASEPLIVAGTGHVTIQVPVGRVSVLGRLTTVNPVFIDVVGRYQPIIDVVGQYSTVIDVVGENA